MRKSSITENNFERHIHVLFKLSVKHFKLCLRRSLRTRGVHMVYIWCTYGVPWCTVVYTCCTRGVHMLYTCGTWCTHEQIVNAQLTNQKASISYFMRLISDSLLNTTPFIRAHSLTSRTASLPSTLLSHPALSKPPDLEHAKISPFNNTIVMYAVGARKG